MDDDIKDRSHSAEHDGLNPADLPDWQVSRLVNRAIAILSKGDPLPADTHAQLLAAGISPIGLENTYG